MKVLYLDCYSGLSGNMFLGALLHLGLDEAAWRAQLERLPLGPFEARVSRVRRSGVAALHVEVLHPPQHAHRGLEQVLEIVRRARLDRAVELRATRIFTGLAQAEAQAHGTTPDQVHFHEVGAIDAIVDVVGAAILLEMADVEQVWASPVCTGFGRVQCEHGVMPVPTPATALLLRRIPTYAGEVEHELCTPTGAAILSATATRFGPQPPLSIEQVGWGAGTLDLAHPNCLRALRGTAVEATTQAGAGAGPGACAVGQARDSLDLEQQEVVELEFHVDDMTGEELGFLQQQLFAAGALDVLLLPAQMKKGRPATAVRVLGRPADESVLIGAILRDASTLGLRVRHELRLALRREAVRVETQWGTVAAWRVRWQGTVRLLPEYEDCAALARDAGLRLEQVLAAARDGRVL